MIVLMHLTGYAVLGLIAWRDRGGVLNEIAPFKVPEILARVVAAALLALPMLFVMRWQEVGILALALFVGMVFPYFTDKDRDGKTLDGFMAMMFRGLVAGAPAAIVLTMIGLPGWPLAVGGLLMGPAYKLASYIPSKIHDLMQGAELGEGLFGIAFGVAHGVVLILIAFHGGVAHGL